MGLRQRLPSLNNYQTEMNQDGAFVVFFKFYYCFLVEVGGSLHSKDTGNRFKGKSDKIKFRNFSLNQTVKVGCD